VRKVRRLASALAALCLAACARPGPPGVTELTYASPYAPGHPFSRADITWMKFVAAQSHGTLRIRPIWSGGLISSDMSMEELRHGVADIGLITPIYVRGGTQLIRTQTGFYSGAASIASQLALYRCIVADNPEMARETAGLKVLAVQGGSLPGIVTRNRQVRNLGDLAGLRLRAPTELLSVLRNLGADPVDMPMGEVYSALSKGVIDGVVAPADTFRSLHFAEVAKFFNTLEVPRGAYPARAMGLKTWNALTPDDRRVLDEATPVWEAALDHEITAAWQKGYAEAVHQHVAISAPSAADQARFDALYLHDAEVNARKLDRFGIDGIGAFRNARAAVTARDQISCGGRS